MGLDAQGTDLGNAESLQSEIYRFAKLSRALTWAHQPEGFDTDGIYLLHMLFGRGC